MGKVKPYIGTRLLKVKIAQNENHPPLGYFQAYAPIRVGPTVRLSS